ncbi:MAG: hypothetical protein AB1716_10830 [Planctomycetota bacterium]
MPRNPLMLRGVALAAPSREPLLRMLGRIAELLGDRLIRGADIGELRWMVRLPPVRDCGESRVPPSRGVVPLPR